MTNFYEMFETPKILGIDYSPPATKWLSIPRYYVAVADVVPQWPLLF